MSALTKDLRTFLLLIFLSLLILFLDNFHSLDFLKGGLEKVTVPIQYGLYKSSLVVGKQFSFIAFSRKNLQEKKALEEQLATVISENANLRRSLSEAQGTLLTQKVLDPRVYDLVSTRPISFSRYLIIDKGADDGIKQGMSVVYKDTFLGSIKATSAKTSEVLMSSDPDSKIAVFSQDKDGKARGVVHGQFGSDILMDKILHQEPIKSGDLVYSEGSDSLPKGLVLGSVSTVLDRPNEIFKQAKVSPIFKVTDLDIVFVIRN